MLALAVAAALAACSDDDSGSSDAGAGAGASDNPFVAAPDDGSPASTVTDELLILDAPPSSTFETSLGTVRVAGPDGRTLYTFDEDVEPGTSSCNGSCAVTWPPVYASVEFAIGEREDGFYTVRRDDGSAQWAFGGRPLYLFSGDAAAGDVNGEGAGGVWFVARPSGEGALPETAGGDTAFEAPPSDIRRTAIGDVLVAGADARTVYTFDEDEPGVSNCAGDCAATWPPVLASVEVPRGEREDGFYTIGRDDGAEQWVLRGRPLYLFSGDAVEGDVNGEGIGGVWFAARLQPSDAPSAVLDTAVGEVHATIAQRRTVYTFDEDAPGISTCTDDCAATWPPVPAAAEYAPQDPSDRFSTISRPDGTLQWALAERPLYFFSGDAATGDVNGEGIGDVWFAARPTPAAEQAGRLVGAASVSAGDGDSWTRTDYAGRTLYTFSGDGENESACVDACADGWPPLHADPGAVAQAPYSILERADGTRQWAYQGAPLYFYAGDAAPGETHGDGESGQWALARTQPSARR